ncbi:DHA2 family efflux MFS transporter permease subunit [Sphingomonas immobilis]|uniref:DHA2 family efflux MFS transporter permease subunit n=1 Tax=Sphingomonas immobilis TaxID=3063997 RepID=A0ABT8ZZ29_9SPHN|nr:DHA2 family efflux MFS transporter permease subunit [Sphingomonas sp. CA1-15]MDO7842832.1 DHA2 family efflux MFS transporter permease subunit [Sphingomonas sp. CA1-15]
MTAAALPDPATRRLITLTVMAATVMTSLDSTIANVALPHMRGSVGASQEEITWALTSFIVASAITIPLTGWAANRFGRKRVMMLSVLFFTIASALCGVAGNIGELVGFRVLQGIAGAGLMPLSQAILLDINPPEQHGQAMALWGMGAILGPIVGPVLGGYLTDNYSWRWIFYINVPVGIAAYLGLSAFLSESKADEVRKLDFFGFAMLALAVGTFQLMLDRGQQQDWFTSTEICIEAALAGFFLFAFIVQTFTAAQPFIDLGLFRDANFVFGCLFGFITGIMLFSVMALLPTLMQQLFGYPVMLTGIVMAPRGVGSLISMMCVGVFIKVIDMRLLIGGGLALIAYSMYLMAGMSLQMDDRLIIISGLFSGLGTGMMFVPLTAVAFGTLPERYRNEGAAMFTLIRNLGSAVGISIVQTMTIRSADAAHSQLVEKIRPDNPMLDLRMPGFDFDAPAAVAMLNGEVTRQAMMLSYVNVFTAMFIAALAVIPLVLLLRVTKGGPQVQIHVE